MALARNRALHEAEAVWCQTWFPRVAEANGRKFLHEVDDVKDHLPDRTVEMTYLVLRQMQLPVNDWFERVRGARNRYAEAHQVPARDDKFDWQDLEPVSGLEAGATHME